jgi:hypothetical protein
MAQKLPPFDQLQDKKKPAAPPPFDQLKSTKTPEAPVVAPASGATAKPAKKKKGANKRKKLAMPLIDFAKLYKQGHAMFFQHVRVPDENNISEWDNKPLPGPKGGATILIDLLNDSSLRFSFAICNLEENDTFVKDEARKMCQDRFVTGELVHVDGYTDTVSIVENISEAIAHHLKGLEHRNGPHIRTMASAISNDNLSTLRRYIKRYSLDNPCWEARK